MADDSDSIGNLKVSITGDYSGLIDDLNIVENLAKQGGDAIAQGMSSGAGTADALGKAVGVVADHLQAGTISASKFIEALNADIAEKFGDSLADDAQSAAKLGQELSTAGKFLGDFDHQLGSAGTSAGQARDELGRFTSGAKDAGDSAEKAGSAARGAAEDGFKPASEAVASLSERLTAAGHAFTDVGTILTGVFTVPLAAIGGALLKVGLDMDEASDTIRGKTGLVGDSLASMNRSFDEVASNVPQKLSAVTETLVTLEQRLSITGAPLEALSEQILNLSRVTGEQLGPMVDGAAKVFQRWKIDTDDQSGALDKLYVASTQTGTGVNTMLGILRQFAPALQEMGFGFNQAVALIATFEQAGLNTQRDITALQQAMLKLGKAGMADPIEGLQLIIEGIKGAGTQGEANALGLKLFGRGAADMVVAIQDGRLNVDAFAQSLNGQQGAIANAAKDTLSFADKVKELGNKFEVEARPAAEAFVKVLENFLDRAGPVLKTVGDLSKTFADLDPIVQTAIVGVGGLTALLGPAAVGFGLVLNSLAPVAKLLGFGSGGVAAEATVAGEALGELATAEGLAASAAGTFSAAVAGIAFAGFTAGIIATIGNLNELHDRWIQVAADMRQKQLFEGIADGKTVEQLKALGFSVAEIGTAMQGTGRQIDQTKLSINSIKESSATAGGAIDDFGIRVTNTKQAHADAAKAVDDFGFHITKGTGAVTDAIPHHDALGTSVKGAGASAKDAAPHHEEVAKSISNTTPAAGNATAALEKLLASHKNNVLSVDDLLTKNKQLNADLTLAQGVYDALTARVRAGSGEYNAQSEALKQVNKVLKELGQDQTNVNAIVAIAEEKNGDLTDKITAQYQAVGQLTEKYGPHNGIVIQADKAYEGLLKQLGLTKNQFADLIAESDETGVSITELVNDAHAVADAFKEMGITSSAQVKQMADDNRDAYNQIVTDTNSSLGDIYQAKQKSLDMDHRERDSLDGVAQAYKDLGIQSSQAIRDSIEKMTIAYDQLKEAGGQAFGDLQRASDALRDKQHQLAQSTSGMEDNYKALGITSSAQFKYMSDEAHIRLDRIRADGNHTYGDMQAALDAVAKADKRLHDSIYGTGEEIKNAGRLAIQFGADGTRAFDGVHGSVKNVNAALLDLGAITVDDTSKMAGLVLAFGEVASSAAAAAKAGVAAAQAVGAAGDAAMKNYGMLPPSSFGGSGSSGMGSFQLGNKPGEFTITHPASGGFDIFQNTAFTVGGESAQADVEYWMSKGYSFADAKSKAHFDGWDVSQVKNPAASAGAGGGGSIGGGPTASVPSTGSGMTPGGAGYPIVASGGMGSSLVQGPSLSGSSSIPGMTAEDVAAFLAMGVTLDQLKAATAPGPVVTKSTSGSLMSMQEQGFTLPSGVTIPTGNGPAQLVGMGSQEFQLPAGATLTTQNGPAQLVGMSSMAAAPAATNYSFSTTPSGGMTAAQVQAEQDAAAKAQLSYWSSIPQTPYTPPAGTAKPIPTVQQTADLSSLQFGGGITAGMTFEQMSALAAKTAPPPAVVDTTTKLQSAATDLSAAAKANADQIAKDQALADKEQAAAEANKAAQTAALAEQQAITAQQSSASDAAKIAAMVKAGASAADVSAAQTDLLASQAAAKHVAAQAAGATEDLSAVPSLTTSVTAALDSSSVQQQQLTVLEQILSAVQALGSVSGSNIPTDVSTNIGTPPTAPAAPVAPVLPTAAVPAVLKDSGNVSVAHTGAASGGITVNVYATVSTQAMADSLVHSIQNLGVATGKV